MSRCLYGTSITILCVPSSNLKKIKNIFSKNIITLSLQRAFGVIASAASREINLRILIVKISKFSKSVNTHNFKFPPPPKFWIKKLHDSTHPHLKIIFKHLTWQNKIKYV